MSTKLPNPRLQREMGEHVGPVIGRPDDRLVNVAGRRGRGRRESPPAWWRCAGPRRVAAGLAIALWASAAAPGGRWFITPVIRAFTSRVQRARL
jgi:hypothetical protein